jgi:hypothetical protein
MRHLDCYLAADGVDLTTEVLDRTDQIVHPGRTVDITDNYWQHGRSRSSAVAAHKRRSRSRS